MYVINARNVNDALVQGIDLIKDKGVEKESRNGLVLELPSPVATVYQNPHEKVLINSARDANPFFHLMESLWILAGRSDVKFLTEFNSRMGDYSDDGVIFNAPYGHRMRKGIGCLQDQIANVISVLKADPMSRQAVIQIWDDNDLLLPTKDKACNMSVVFSLRHNMLNITVFNRSNDMIWGAYGANAVQFAMLQEYVAAHLGAAVGTYTQVSNNMHVYVTGAAGEQFSRIKNSTHRVSTQNPYEKFDPEKVELIGYSRVSSFEQDLKRFFEVYDRSGLYRLAMEDEWESDYFNKLVKPMLDIWSFRKKADNLREATITSLIRIDTIKSPDWAMGAAVWLDNRMENL